MKTLFDNYHIYGEKYTKEMENSYLNFLNENEMYEKLKKYKEGKQEYKDDVLYEYIYETLDDDLDLLSYDLNIQLNNPIICIGSMGLWNGRKIGYKIIGNNINRCFKDIMGNYDYVNYYCDNTNLRADLYHHDGTNHIVFKELLENRIPYNTEEFISNKMYNSNFNKFLLKMKNYTKSLRPYIAELYGWDKIRNKTLAKVDNHI